MNKKIRGQRKQRSTENRDYRVDITFGYQRYIDISYTKAAEIVLRYIDIEQKHSEMFVRSTVGDSSILAFCEIIGQAQKPERKNWENAKSHIYKGLQRLSMANSYAAIYQDSHVRNKRSEAALSALKSDLGRHLEEASKHLQMAKNDFNKGHKQWIEYRNRLNFGGEIALVMMELTIILAVGYATAGIGTHLTGIAAKSGLSAGIAFFEQSSRTIGMDIQGVEKLNWKKIIENTIISGLSSLGGSYLSNRFLNKITSKIDFQKIWLRRKGALGGGYVLAPKNQIDHAFRLDEFGFKLRRYLSEFICNSIGKSILTVSIETAIQGLREKDVLSEDKDKLLDRIAIIFTKNLLKQNEKHLLLLLTKIR